jgi:small-conductance mechanosensitive channel
MQGLSAGDAIESSASADVTPRPSPTAAIMEIPTFDAEAVIARLLENLYGLLAALPLLLVALVIIWLGWLLGSWLSRRSLIERAVSANPLLSNVARSTTRWVVTGLSMLLALELLDATALVGAMLGTAGVVGIAIGFAFKDTLENYLAGLLMSFRQPFSPKDEVVINGEAGTVIALTSRATVLMTPDGNHLRLPNAMVFRSMILNYTRNPSRRFEFDVGIGVQEDLICAQNIGIGELTSLAGVLDSPPPKSFIVSLGDSSVQLRFRGWVDQREYDFWMVRSEAIRKVKLALEAADMDMPEPTYRVQLSGGADTLIGVTPESPAKSHRVSPPPDESEAPDTRADFELEEQIERDRGVSDSTNLLDADAPKE